MDRDFKAKCEESKQEMNKILQEIEGSVDKLSKNIDTQMDTLDKR